MERFAPAEDMTTYFMEATSFPEGVLAAHQALHALVSYPDGICEEWYTNDKDVQCMVRLHDSFVFKNHNQ